MKKLFFVSSILLCTVSFLESMQLKNNDSPCVEIRQLDTKFSQVSPLHDNKWTCFHTRSLQFIKVGIQVTYELSEKIDDRIHIGSSNNLLAFKKDHEDYRELRKAIEGIAHQEKVESFSTSYQILYAPHVEKIQEIIDKNK